MAFKNFKIKIRIKKNSKGKIKSFKVVYQKNSINRW